MSDATAFPRIQPLPEHIASQIAAGEVIERPASVVKELIENSIDAAATHIDIEIEKAGRSLIRVTDNGQGIHPDDLPLALQAHATSKLNQFADLGHIVSMGFRGEAIPSIASVSRFSIATCRAEDETGWLIDNQLIVKPTAHPQGTTVEVRELFYSTPARRKFLKTDRTERLHIESLVKAIALSHPTIQFKLCLDGHTQSRYTSCSQSPEQRVRDICGRAFLENSLTIEATFEGLRLSGWLGLSATSRSQSDKQYFFVNQRLVKDKHVNHAIRLCYQDEIAAGRFPSYVLMLEMDPAQIDINVHPAKSEVRFAQPRNVHDAVYSTLTRTLAEANNSADFIEATDTAESVAQYQLSESARPYTLQSVAINPERQAKPAALEYITLFDGEYLLARIEQRHWLIHVPVARQLIVLRQLRNGYQNQSLIKRPILVPVTLKLDSDSIESIENNAQRISNWAFDLQPISSTQILVRSIPGLLDAADIQALVINFIELIRSKKEVDSIAKGLAFHVNDSGLSLQGQELQQLVNAIKRIEEDTSLAIELPWQRLDKSCLDAWLKQG